MHILQWLQEVNCAVNTCSYIMAAQGGFIHIIQWLHSQKIPIDEWSFTWCMNEDDYSKQDNESTMLACAKARGYNYNNPPAISTIAAQLDNLEILKWVKENNLP